MIPNSKPLIVAVFLSFAATPATSHEVNQTSRAASISVEKATAIALEAQPGIIAEVELDQFEGKPAYDIEIVNTAGKEIEFKVDAVTGEILNRWIDDDPTDDPDASTDAGG